MNSTRQTFTGDTLKLSFGTVTSQAIIILSAPILVRLYGPEAFGMLAIFVAVERLIVFISCLRYENAILLPEKDKDAANILAISIVAVLVVSGITFVILVFAGNLIVRLLDSPGLENYLWVIAPTVLASGIFLALSYWNSRIGRFGRLSIAKIVATIGMISSQLILALFLGPVGLLIGFIFGEILGSIVLIWQIWMDDGELIRRSIKAKEMLASLKRYRKFPLYTSWASLLNYASWQLPAFILAIFFTSTIVGYYSLGNRVLRVPMIFVGTSIATVFFQRASLSHSSNQDLSNMVETVIWRLILVGLFPMLLVTLIGEELFSVVFGAEWAEAGVYTQILAIWMFFVFISSPLSALFSVLERQEFSLLFNIVLFATRFASLWIGGVMGDPRLALILFAVSGVFCYSWLLLWILRSTGASSVKVAKMLFRGLIYSGLALVPLIIFELIGIFDSWGSLIGGGIGIVLYLLLIMYKEQELVLTTVQSLNILVPRFNSTTRGN